MFGGTLKRGAGSWTMARRGTLTNERTMWDAEGTEGFFILQRWMLEETILERFSNVGRIVREPIVPLEFYDICVLLYIHISIWNI